MLFLPQFRVGSVAALAAGATAGGWLPSQLATLKLWLKGDSNAGADGSAITTWTDVSGLGNHATGSGSAPTVKAADLNGLNTARFTASSHQYFALPNFLTGFAAGSGIWLVKLVADPPGIDDWTGGVFKTGSDTSSNGDNHYPYADGHVYEDFGNNSRRDLGVRPGSFAAWHMSSMHAASGDFRMYINGTSFYSTASNTVSWATTPMIGRGLRGGGSSPVAFLNGWLAELIFVNEVLSTGDRQKLEGYLAHKWGIQSVLDSGHPYKSAPP